MVNSASVEEEWENERGMGGLQIALYVTRPKLPSFLPCRSHPAVLLTEHLKKVIKNSNLHSKDRKQ